MQYSGQELDFFEKCVWFIEKLGVLLQAKSLIVI